MRSFTTHDGNTWHCDLNLAVAYQVQQEQEEFTDILGKIKPEWADKTFRLIEHDKDSADEFMSMAVATPILLKLSWLCVRDQARHLTVPDLSQEIPEGAHQPLRPYTEMDYIKGFKGDTVFAVKEVMLQELADFIPQMGTLFLKYLELHRQSLKLASKKLQDVGPSLDMKIQDLLGEQEKQMNKAIDQVDQLDLTELSQ